LVVYVINKHGKPLMPCSPRKARILLKQGKAKIIKREPFTIQLLYGSSGYKQPISLGVDAGSKHIGISATTENKVLFEAEVELRTDIVDLISTRRQYRRSRRNRKTRYRKARFLNRKKPKGWLAPSIQNKIEAHLKAVNLVHQLLPISKTIIEVASFDIQRIKNPSISGKEYQEGDQLGFWNTREYVLWRDNHQCQGKKNCKNNILNVHHIESRKTGGDAPNNLITLCEQCHKDYHAGKLKLNLKRGKSYKHAAFMGIMRWAVYNRLKEISTNVSLTYGYITKNTRIRNKLEKSHIVDARCISGNPLAKPDVWYYFKQVRKKKRSLHEAIPRKGRKEQNRLSIRNEKNTKHVRHQFNKWCLHDRVLLNDQIGFISGFTGNWVYVQDIFGNYIQASNKYKQVNPKELTLVCRNNNWVSVRFHLPIEIGRIPAHAS
jgi:hypothetical protein